MVKNKKIANLLYVLAFTLACIRGLIEYFVGRSTAFTIQLIGIIIFLGLLIDYRHIYKLISSSLLGLYVMLIILISLLSALATFFINGYFGENYFILIVFTLFLFLFSKSAKYKKLVNVEFAYKFALLIGFVLTLFALMQELRLNVIEFPGRTADFGLIRPQSITGSFLHYPLIISIITCITFIVMLKELTVSNVLIFIYFFLSLIFTLSRSGMFISFFVILYYVITKFNVKIAFFIFAIALITFFLGIYLPNETEIIFNRIFGSTSISSDPGNGARYEVWKIGIGMLSYLNILIGTFFGLVTNSAPEQYSKGIVESGVLQQILNIGLIGTVFYYAVLWQVRKLLSPEYIIILVACILQTFIYQSIEVIPFLFLLITLPLYTI